MIKKFIALTLFLGGIFAFVGYRSGWFSRSNTFAETATTNVDQEEEEPVEIVDSFVPVFNKKPDLEKVFLPSSKSIVIKPPKVIPDDERPKITPRKQEATSAENTQEAIMFSSKSGYIFQPLDFDESKVRTLASSSKSIIIDPSFIQSLFPDTSPVKRRGSKMLLTDSVVQENTLKVFPDSLFNFKPNRPK